MAKYKTFYGSENERDEHDECIAKFLDKLEEEGHTLIRVNTVIFGEYKENMDCFRTEITYTENHTRKTITEKTK